MKTVKARELKDALAIESYLARQGIYIKFSPEQDSDTDGIRFEEFVAWFEEKIPEKGDTIVLLDSHTIGVVQAVGLDSITLGVGLSGTDFTASPLVVPKSAFRPAEREEMFRLQRELNRHNLCWNSFCNKVTGKLDPVNNLQLRVSLLGKRVALGAFREINEKGEIVMYCVKENDRPVRYSLYEAVGPASDYQLEAVNTVERKTLADELEKAGKVWNGHAKRIEPIHLRSKRGEVYYHIDDYWTVVATRDDFKPKDRKRLHSGNYFRSQEEAQEILSRMVEQRNRMLIEDSGTPSAEKPVMMKKRKYRKKGSE
ncbi:MAG: hypothetical protein LBP72_01285 [Dysgonamonadaceae bacterium]|nr:hypothetical protein [Dysgonamonadaceae bacterium]